MKKMILLCFFVCLLCTACGGVRKNWKIMKNTQLIMVGQPINVAKNVYGEPTSVRLLADGQTAYIWDIDHTNEERGISTTTSGSTYDWWGSSTATHSGHSFSRKVYGGWCYLAVKVNKRGIITDTMNKGFHDQFAAYEPECAAFFKNSRRFCNGVQSLSKKSNKQGDCHRKDYTTVGPKDGFIIPGEYYKTPVKKKTDYEKFFE